MWNRAELKSRGKVRFKDNYWKCVVVSLLLAFSIGGSAVGSGYRSVSSMSDFLVMHEDFARIAAIVIGAVVIALLMSFVINIFVMNPLAVGCQRFFIVNTRENAGLNEVSFGFEHSYGNMVKTMFLRDVYLILWSCLLVIPGLIKMYAYRMVPYILADDPHISGKDAIALSCKMMDGNKWKVFVLDLSFLGWLLLSACTCGILQMFYVGPYIAATNAELYETLKVSFIK